MTATRTIVTTALGLTLLIVAGCAVFAGSLQVESRFTDASTGQLLAVAIARGIGGGSVKAAAQVKWGDAIDFELRARTSQFERWPTIRSELAIAVYAALHGAGMTIPFPQREVRLVYA